mgnify:CR=1 FL=1
MGNYIDLIVRVKHKKVTAKHSQTKGKRKSIGFMFACVARGSHVHGRPGVESALFRKHFPRTPLVGFFGNGELGPIAGKNFLHGYTASLTLLLQKQD